MTARVNAAYVAPAKDAKAMEYSPIPGFQEGRTFGLGEPIPIPPKRGWMLELHARHPPAASR